MNPDCISHQAWNAILDTFKQLLSIESIAVLLLQAISICIPILLLSACCNKVAFKVSRVVIIQRFTCYVLSLANFYFFARELGTSFTFTCLLGSNVTSSWVTVDNEIIIPPANTNNVTIVFSKITDLSHGRNYSCHGNISTSLLHRKFTLAVLGEC